MPVTGQGSSLQQLRIDAAAFGSTPRGGGHWACRRFWFGHWLLDVCMNVLLGCKRWRVGHPATPLVGGLRLRRMAGGVRIQDISTSVNVRGHGSAKALKRILWIT